MRPNRLRRHRRRIAASTVVALSLPALSLLAAGAVAYWSNAGEASASANLADAFRAHDLERPAGAGTVALVGRHRTLQRNGRILRDARWRSPSGGPSSSSPSTATSCTDTGVSIGAHEYTVTAAWRTWTTTSPAKMVTVTFGPATHFQITAASTTPTAGETDNLTIIAKDAATTRSATTRARTATSKAPMKPAAKNRASSTGQASKRTSAKKPKSRSPKVRRGIERHERRDEALQGRSGAHQGQGRSLNNATGLAVTVKAAAAKKLSCRRPPNRKRASRST